MMFNADKLVDAQHSIQEAGTKWRGCMARFCPGETSFAIKPQTNAAAIDEGFGGLRCAILGWASHLCDYLQ